MSVKPIPDEAVNQQYAHATLGLHIVYVPRVDRFVRRFSQGSFETCYLITEHIEGQIVQSDSDKDGPHVRPKVVHSVRYMGS